MQHEDLMERVLPPSWMVWLCTIAALGMSCADSIAAPAAGPLRVHPTNPRYFTDGTKHTNGSFNAIYLTGSHTWFGLSDGDKGPDFDYPGYLNFLDRYPHNFIRLWSCYNLARSPIPYERTGPGMALDGQPKVDLARLDSRFFDRLRAYIQAARDRGMYVGIMLFAPDGAKKKDWPILLFNPANNVQEINADTNKDDSGAEAYDLSIPRITAYQEAFVRKVIDTVNDLDNVLYEIGNEGDFTSVPWQYHFIRLIRTYEAGKPKQHPVGMTAVFNILDGSWATDNRVLFESPADWISPGLDPYKDNPPAADGRKVMICDVDHIWPAAPHHGWVWECFLRGLQPILMDQYHYGEPKWTSSAEQEAMRKNMGYTLTHARKMQLASLVPSNALASTTYCLANPGAEYLIYQPKPREAFSVDLQAGAYSFEWFDRAKGAIASNGSIQAPGGTQSFQAPFEGEAVLYLKTK